MQPCTKQPWLAGFDAALCEAVLASVAAGGDALALLHPAFAAAQIKNAQGLPLHCVPQAALPAGVAYEQFIYDTGGIPTRNTAGSAGALHDACNALMWLRYPRSKARLNELQAAAIAKVGVQPTRGRLRDALTLFDESAVILCVPEQDCAIAQLVARDWRGLLHTRRSDWLGGTVSANLFGHAVLQKLQNPYPAITAQVWCVQGEIEALDTALAASLTPSLSPAQLLPLPVLGIPGWWAANADAVFYNNAQVFRPL